MLIVNVHVHVRPESAEAFRRATLEALRRYDEIARKLTGSEHSKARDGIALVKEICESLRIPSLRSCGISSEDFPELIESAARVSSTKGNPIELTRDEMGQILARAL